MLLDRKAIGTSREEFLYGMPSDLMIAGREMYSSHTRKAVVFQSFAKVCSHGGLN